jgi:hypothetical protein
MTDRKTLGPKAAGPLYVVDVRALQYNMRTIPCVYQGLFSTINNTIGETQKESQGIPESNFVHGFASYFNV